MKYLQLLLLLIITQVSFSQEFYHKDSIPTIEIDFFNPNWESVLDAYKQAGLTTRLLANVTINGEFIDSAGVRFKGNSTYDASNAKNPLNIQLDFTDGGSDYDGYRTLKLSNGKNDPSFVREVTSYEIAHNYMVAPLCNFVKVIVNGSTYGIFSNSESVNTDFTDRYLYGGNNGARFQCNPENVGGDGSSLQFYSNSESSYYDFYELDSDTGWFKLVHLIDTLNNYPDELSSILDVDRAIWMLAYNNVLINLDSYIGPFRQNYYLLENGRDILNTCIWDLNQSLGSFGLITIGGPPPTLNNLGSLDPFLRQNDTDWPLLNHVLNDNRLSKQYMAHFRTIYDEQVKTDNYLTLANEWQDVIETELNADPNKLYSINNFNDNINSSVTTGGGPGGTTYGITEVFNIRKTFIEANTEYLKVGPTISNVNNGVVTSGLNTTATISAEISNATYAYLGYRFTPKDQFTKIDMTASGNTYTASVPVDVAEMDYYIYAENSDAGSFSPARAEFEYHQLAVVGDLVINEIQSSNRSTQFDEVGEYNDWIEVYNNSDVSIDITDYYISDNKDSLNKWKIPNLTINSDEYIIFWADKDTLQGENHTNFRLTKNGESLYLSTSDLTPLDQLTYIPQTTDLTYARIPNGVGPFRISSPTFQARNDSTVGILNRTIDDLRFTIFPNPSFSGITINGDQSLKGSLISIINVNGQKVLEQMWSSGSQQQIDLPNLERGVYLIQVGDSKALKLVKL